VAVADGRAAFDASASGTLVYRAAAPAGGERAGRDELRLLVRARDGREVRQVPARVAWTPRVSPDGRLVAYGAFPANGGASELWTTDLGTGATRQLTGGGDDANDPQWSPDARTLAYSAVSEGDKRVFLRPAAGGPARPLAHGGGSWFPTDWLPGGRAVLATADRDGNRDVLVVPADGDPARPYAATPAREGAARVSPDGRWVAYQSDEGGRDEVYVDGYPTPGRRTRVSAAGGVHPAGRATAASCSTGRGTGSWRRASRRAPAARRRWPRARRSSGRGTRGRRRRRSPCTTSRPTGGSCSRPGPRRRTGWWWPRTRSARAAEPRAAGPARDPAGAQDRWSAAARGSPTSPAPPAAPPRAPRAHPTDAMTNAALERYRDRMRRVLDHVDAHLDDDLGLAALAAVAACSKHHFHRQFAASVGVTAHRYVQLARMKRASYRLAFRADATVTAVALDAGYEAADAFARAFRGRVGQLPSAFRTSPDWARWRAASNPSPTRDASS
jgi:AraC-like DNA-binding protein